MLEKNFEQEIKYLEAENADLKHKCDNQERNINELQAKINLYSQDIKKLNNTIEFYKGQVEAYQYCMNFRR